MTLEYPGNMLEKPIYTQQLELDRISLPQSAGRVAAEKGLSDLKQAIAQDGQQQPVIVCPKEGDGYVLLDSYRRYKALGQLARDKIQAGISLAGSLFLPVGAGRSPALHLGR